MSINEHRSEDHQEQSGVVEAEMLGSVSQACKMMGYRPYLPADFPRDPILVDP